MKAPLALAAALVFLAGAAGAQAPAPTEIPGAAPAAAAKPPPTGNTVSGITVKPLPRKTCAARDKDCVAMVVAQLKEFYPEQLKQFCFQWETQRVRTELTNTQLMDALDAAGQNNGPPTPTGFGVNSAVKTACAPDKK